MYELVKDIGLCAYATSALKTFIRVKKLDINFGYKQKQDGYKRKVRTLNLDDIKKVIARVEQGIRDKDRFTYFGNGGYMVMYKILKDFVKRIENEQNEQSV